MKAKIATLLLIGAITVFAIHILYTAGEGARLDLTETQLYSLTEGTNEILDKMQKDGVKPVDVTLYFSYTAGKTLPRFIKNFITYEAYIRNLLKEYERYGNGKIRVSYVDPKPDSDEAQDAADFGLDGKPINQEGDKFFFGILFQTQTGSKDVIDFLWPEKQETIEYEISKTLYNLMWPTKKRIAVMSGVEPLPDDNPYMAQLLRAQGKQPSKPWASMEVLKESYESCMFSDGETISRDDYDLLMVIHPRNFGDKEMWLINEWVVSGGNTMVFLDNYSIEDRPPPNPQNQFAALQYKPASNLTKLTDAWGLKMPDEQFAVDYALAANRAVDRSGRSFRVLPDLIIDQSKAAATINADSPIFQGLDSVRFFTAAPLKKSNEAPEALTFTELLTTTEEGAALTVKPGFGGRDELAYIDFQNPNKMLDMYKPEAKQVLAYRISGQFPSAYPEGASFPKETPQAPPGMPPGFQMPPSEDAEMISKEPIAADQFAEASVIVFSDSDFISDQLAFQRSFFGLSPLNDNYKVLLNTVDFLLGAQELMKVRSKQKIRRPFVVFDEIEAEADRRLLDQEREIRANIERFQEELRNKQSNLSQENATLLAKRVQDEIDELNAKIKQDERKLREIRKAKRAELESQQTFLSGLIIGLMPIVICVLGLINVVSRRSLPRSKRS